MSISESGFSWEGRPSGWGKLLMVFWKIDPVYRRIFHEVMTLWQRLDPSNRPMAVRVEEHDSPFWDQPGFPTTILHTWMVDDDGPRMFQGLKREKYFPGGPRGDYSQFGLIRFHIASEEGFVAFASHLGPRIDSERVFLLEESGQDWSRNSPIAVS